MSAIFRSLETLFPLGQIVTTPGAVESISTPLMFDSLRRHATGDWGDIHEDDRGLNEEALTNGSRILSVYLTPSGDKFWIITEADRSVTTILLPSEY